MGVDLQSVPVLLGSEPVQAIRRDEALWDTASYQPPFNLNEEIDEPLPEVSQAMMADRPSALHSLKAPWCEGRRGFGKAEYALDPAAYRRLDSYEERERSLPYRIIEGDRRFADHARSGQGMLWRCSDRAFLIEAADTIEALDEAAIRREFSLKEMADLGVYKTRRDEDEEETFAHAMDDLRWLARYYHEVAAHGYDLIVVMY